MSFDPTSNPFTVALILALLMLVGLTLFGISVSSFSVD
jgi:hypothetical protein